MENPGAATGEHGSGPRAKMRAGTGRPSTRALVVAGAIVLAAAVAIVLWLVLRGGGQTVSRSRPLPAGAASAQRLNAIARSIGHPVYWIGPQPRFVYELSRTKDGRVYIRYLPHGAMVGDTRPHFLTVGTYPQPHALAVLKARAARSGSPTVKIADGGVALVDPTHPTSVYIAYPSLDLQVEVFDPSPRRARQLVTSGQIAPVR